MKITMAQLNPLVGDLEGNATKIIEACQSARQKGAELIIFPELTLTGYPPLDLLERKAFISANLAMKEKLIEKIMGIAFLFGYVAINPGSEGPELQNAAVFAKDGKILGEIRKVLLPQYDVFDECRYFAPGKTAEPVLYGGLRFGITICEDAWNSEDIPVQKGYTENPVADIAPGSDILINLSASPFHVDKVRLRDQLFSGIARQYAIPVLEVNQAGANDTLVFDGASTAYDRKGNIIGRAAAFEEDLILVDLEKNTGDIRLLPEREEDQIHRALVTGIRDYLHKCGFTKAVVGSSGGIDSALVLALAAEALSAENIISVFMPGPYTAADNFEDTRLLAENLKIRLDIVPIQQTMEAMAASSSLFDPESHGITEQNLQARIRGTLIMGYANRYHALALPTGNKAEMAVGYSTLYGDMNGGLAVLGDVSKTRVWALSRRINEKAGFALIPERIIEKAPSAELKPDQRDQDDLPDYGVVDAIVAHHVEDLEDAESIIARGYAENEVRDVIRRIQLNEYKRQQAAPVIRITSRSFGYGRRYPMACRLHY
ncbi:NAD+ synthase [Desulfobotulus mexicanus]|uniref:Glutamine-dependent NAD(+) synthetase n=1 Tax=Desulfobotulus mexicanus TaxID=2586642 RepID=A0A5Q4VFA0_9BACT|nr:NAD+ synthase [Desulfobotulus mexicanus]TYT76355.1 NAD+ synthase [Desulfobotulus mexicanus]